MGIPERSFIVAPVAYSDPADSWVSTHPRPITLFPPEPIAATGSRPPARFRWRRMSLTTGRTTGPERIAPEWWLQDDNWHSGLRDYGPAYFKSEGFPSRRSIITISKDDLQAALRGGLFCAYLTEIPLIPVAKLALTAWQFWPPFVRCVILRVF